MNRPVNEKAVITKREIQTQFGYNTIAVLTLHIAYPEISLVHSPSIAHTLNDQYQNEERRFHHYASGTLADNAIAEYHYSVQNGFPFRPYDAVMQYTVTMNENCVLSTYFDQYEYTGGAHGNTLRFSDNWELQTGRRITMGSLFNRGENYQRVVTEQIQKLAQENMRENPNIYFENYRELIAENFNTDSFNLTPTGLAVYFQHYAIGPYSSGIIVFNLPYESLGIQKPSCKPSAR